MRTGAVIAAAGIGKDDVFEPMKVFGSITVIERLILILQKSGVDPIVVVTGNQASVLEKHIRKLGVICLRNSQYGELEMMDSAKIGFSYLKDSCDQILFSPADVALFSNETVKRLIDSGAPLAIPMYGDKEGHPVLIANRLLKYLICYQGKGGLRRALRCCGVKLEKIPVEDEGILIEVSEMDKVLDMVSSHNNQLLRPKCMLSLIREKEFLNQKTVTLLYLIKQTSSVRTACHLMGISYSKCWNLLNVVEEQLGYQILVRHPGGMNGGYTSLSFEGEKLLNQFEQFVLESNKAVEEIYYKIFEDA